MSVFLGRKLPEGKIEKEDFYRASNLPSDVVNINERLPLADLAKEDREKWLAKINELKSKKPKSEAELRETRSIYLQPIFTFAFESETPLKQEGLNFIHDQLAIAFDKSRSEVHIVPTPPSIATNYQLSTQDVYEIWEKELLQNYAVFRLIVDNYTPDIQNKLNLFVSFLTQEISQTLSIEVNGGLVDDKDYTGRRPKPSKKKNSQTFILYLESGGPNVSYHHSAIRYFIQTRGSTLLKELFDVQTFQPEGPFITGETVNKLEKSSLGMIKVVPTVEMVFQRPKINEVTVNEKFFGAHKTFILPPLKHAGSQLHTFKGADGTFYYNPRTVISKTEEVQKELKKEAQLIEEDIRVIEEKKSVETKKEQETDESIQKLVEREQKLKEDEKKIADSEEELKRREKERKTIQKETEVMLEQKRIQEEQRKVIEIEQQRLYEESKKNAARIKRIQDEADELKRLAHEDETKRKAEEKAAAEQKDSERKAAEAQRILDEQAAEVKRSADEAKRKREAEEKAAADHKESERKAAEAKSLFDEKAAELKRLNDEVNRERETAKQKEILEKAEEAKRLLYEKAAEVKRLADEAERKREAEEKATEEQKKSERKAAEAKRLFDEQAAKAKRLADEAERKREAEEKAAEEQKESKRKADEAKRLLDEQTEETERKLAEEKKIMHDSLQKNYRDLIDLKSELDFLVPYYCGDDLEQREKTKMLMEATKLKALAIKNIFESKTDDDLRWAGLNEETIRSIKIWVKNIPKDFDFNEFCSRRGHTLVKPDLKVYYDELFEKSGEFKKLLKWYCIESGEYKENTRLKLVNLRNRILTIKNIFDHKSNEELIAAGIDQSNIATFRSSLSRTPEVLHFESADFCENRGFPTRSKILKEYVKEFLELAREFTELVPKYCKFDESVQSRMQEIKDRLDDLRKLFLNYKLQDDELKASHYTPQNIEYFHEVLNGSDYFDFSDDANFCFWWGIDITAATTGTPTSETSVSKPSEQECLDNPFQPECPVAPIPPPLPSEAECKADNKLVGCPSTSSFSSTSSYSSEKEVRDAIDLVYDLERKFRTEVKDFCTKSENEQATVKASLISILNELEQLRRELIVKDALLLEKAHLNDAEKNRLYGTIMEIKTNKNYEIPTCSESSSSTLSSENVKIAVELYFRLADNFLNEAKTLCDKSNTDKKTIEGNLDQILDEMAILRNKFLEWERLDNSVFTKAGVNKQRLDNIMNDYTNYIIPNCPVSSSSELIDDYNKFWKQVSKFNDAKVLSCSPNEDEKKDALKEVESSKTQMLLLKEKLKNKKNELLANESINKENVEQLYLIFDNLDNISAFDNPNFCSEIANIIVSNPPSPPGEPSEIKPGEKKTGPDPIALARERKKEREAKEKAEAKGNGENKQSTIVQPPLIEVLQGVMKGRSAVLNPKEDENKDEEDEEDWEEPEIRPSESLIKSWITPFSKSLTIRLQPKEKNKVVMRMFYKNILQ